MGRPDQALEYYLKMDRLVKPMLKSEKEKMRYDAWKVSEGLGRLYLKMNDLKNALYQYLYAELLAKNQLGDNSQFLAKILYSLRTIYSKLNDAAKTAEYTNKLATLLKSEVKKNQANIIPEYVNLIKGAKDKVEAAELCEAILKSAKKENWEDHPAAAELYTLFANNSNTPQGKVDMLKTALRIYKEIYGEQNKKATGVYRSLSEACASAGDAKSAEEYKALASEVEKKPGA